LFYGVFFLFLHAEYEKSIHIMKRLYLFFIALIISCNIFAQDTLKVGVMLPLHNIDGDGRRMVEYYRGLLMGIDELKKQGKNISVYAWNVPADADPRTTLLQENASKCNIIFGPLYSKFVKVIAEFCKAYNIKMVIPFSITGDDVDNYPNIYQIYQSPAYIDSVTINRIRTKFAGYHPVIINCNDTLSRKGQFTGALRKAFDEAGVAYNITNVLNADDVFAKAFSNTQHNLVILNSARSPELTKVLNKLDTLTAHKPYVRITMFGYNEWLMYAKFNKEKYEKYDVHLPSNYYYNENGKVVKILEDRYFRYFHEQMSYALPRFALTGYDHAIHMLGKNSRWVQTPLDFKKTPNGGYRNTAYYMIHFKPEGGVEAVKYDK